MLAAAFDYRLLATGTVPHALIQLFPTEEEAFTAVAESFNRYTLLLDTYDPRQAIQTAIAVAQRAQRDRSATHWRRCGWIAATSWRIANTCGSSWRRLAWASVRILASGDLDEFSIADLLAAGAEIDAFGVGTALGAGAGSVEHGEAAARWGRLQRSLLCRGGRRASIPR